MFLQRKINKKCKWLNVNFEDEAKGINQKSSPKMESFSLV